jgi:hypothetical protein
VRMEDRSEVMVGWAARSCIESMKIGQRQLGVLSEVSEQPSKSAAKAEFAFCKLLTLIMSTMKTNISYIPTMMPPVIGQ